MNMAYTSSMALHEELNTMLRQGQRECLQLNGLIRQLKSVQAMLMMKKDTAKKELETYVNKLSESLIDFKSEMHVSIQTELNSKLKEIGQYREKYESHIQSYMELCDSTEKLVQFGKVMASEADIQKAQKLLREFKQLQEVASKKFDINVLSKFEFYPALPVDCISSAVFGDLIKGSPGKRSETPLSVLSARKSKVTDDESGATSENIQTRSQPVIKYDQSTQTDDLSVSGTYQKIEKGTSENTKTSSTSSDTRSSLYTQCDNQQFVAFPQTSPAGMEYIAMPYYTYSSSSQNPPPGFSVLPRPGQPGSSYQPDQLNINPCMITGVPYYNAACPTLAAPSITYPVPNIQYYPCNTALSTQQEYQYKSDQTYSISTRKSCVLPVISPNEVSKIKTEKTEKEVITESAKESKPDLLIEVKDIPLPAGPEPKRNLIVKTDADKVITQKSGSSDLKNRTNANNVDIDKVKVEIDETGGPGYGLEKANNSGNFKKLLKQTSELLESSGIEEDNDMKRIDEGEVWDIKEDITEPTPANTEETADIHRMEIDQMLSNFSHDLKEKLSKGEELLTPIKPLRRPLRLPRNAFSETKIKTERESVSANSPTFETFQDLKQSQETVKLEKSSSSINSLESAMNPVKLETDSEKSEQVFGDIQNVPAISVEPDILDFSNPSGKTLKEVVKGHGLSKRERTVLNRETLQSQTSWLKGYLKQVLPEKKEAEECDENNNGTKESSLPEITKPIPEAKLKRNESVEDSKVVDNVSDAVVTDKQVKEKIPEVIVISDDENDTTKEKKGDSVSGKGTEGATAEATAETSKSCNVTPRKSDLNALKTTVKGYLGNNKEGKPGKQRTFSSSTSSRLGALQAHWLKHSPGTDIKAKFLFECSEKMHFPIGVATNSRQQIIVADTGNHCMKLFDKEGTFIKKFEVKGMHRPSAIVVNEFDHVFVKDDVSILVFDERCKYITEIAKDLHKPFGLVLTPAKCLLVLETDRRRPALAHISQDSSNMWRFPYTPLLNAPPGSKCRFMGVSENNVIVSDLGLSQIYITNLEGIFLKVIGSYGYGFMQFIEPSGISVDNYGNVVIGDSKNNRLQVFRHYGSYTGLISFDEKITRPSGVHLTTDNKLMVVNFLHHTVKVYQLST